MERIGALLTSWEFASPLSFWITGALALICIFFPSLWKKKGIRLDLGFWKKRVRFRGTASWILVGTDRYLSFSGYLYGPGYTGPSGYHSRVYAEG